MILITAAKIRRTTAGMPRNINSSLVASINIKTRAAIIQANMIKVPGNPEIKVRMFHPFGRITSIIPPRSSPAVIPGRDSGSVIYVCHCRHITDFCVIISG